VLLRKYAMLTVKTVQITHNEAKVLVVSCGIYNQKQEVKTKNESPRSRVIVYGTVPYDGVTIKALTYHACSMRLYESFIELRFAYSIEKPTSILGY